MLKTINMIYKKLRKDRKTAERYYIKNGKHLYQSNRENFDNFDKFVNENKRAGYTLLFSPSNRFVFALTDDEKCIEALLSKGFKVDASDIKKAFEDFTGGVEDIETIEDVEDATKYQATKGAHILIDKHNRDATILQGTGKNGRITQSDVEHFLKTDNE